jgi:Mn-dependent DtxR family transcriptional regulator
MNAPKLGTNMRHALKFYATYKELHCFATDRATVNAVNSLARLGLVKINQYHQAKITPKGIELFESMKG